MVTLRLGSTKAEEALDAQVQSGLLPAPVKGGRNAKLWYPLNHAASTSPLTLLGEVSLLASKKVVQRFEDVGGPAGGGEVDECRFEAPSRARAYPHPPRLPASHDLHEPDAVGRFRVHTFDSSRPSMRDRRRSQFWRPAHAGRCGSTMRCALAVVEGRGLRVQVRAAADLAGWDDLEADAPTPRAGSDRKVAASLAGGLVRRWLDGSGR